VNCTANVELPNCTADCKGPTGAVFCGSPPQYVDLADVASDCITYLESQGITISTTCTLGSGCTSGCSAAPTVGAVDDRWGTLGVAGLIMGVGLLVSRRKRRA
jgi:hypothetical protein